MSAVTRENKKVRVLGEFEALSVIGDNMGLSELEITDKGNGLVDIKGPMADIGALVEEVRKQGRSVRAV